MKIMRPIKKILFALGALALAVGGGMVAQSKQSVSAMSASEAVDNPNGPWGLNIDASNTTFYNPVSISGGTNAGPYQARVYLMGTTGSPSYLWSQQNKFDLNKSQVLSYWIFLAPWTTSQPNNGMAFTLQPNGNADTNGRSSFWSGKTSIGGQTLGVWGDPLKSSPWNSAIQDGYGIAFDTYMNGDGYNKEQANTNITSSIYGDSTSINGQSGLDNSYVAYAPGSSAWNLNKRGMINVTNTATGDDMPGAWHHVTLSYKPSGGGAGVMTMSYDDRSLTDKSDTKAQNSTFTKTYNLNSKMFNNKTQLYYGFSSVTQAASNMVVLDTDPTIIDATATATLTDESRDNKTVVSSDTTPTDKQTNFVYGGDTLKYSYTTKLNSANFANGLQESYIRTKLPKEFEPDKDAVTLTTSSGTSSITPNAITKKSDGTYTVDQKVDNLKTAGQTATITITGKAASVTSDTDVPSTDALAYNGGIDQPMTNTAFTIKPAVLTTTSGTIKDLTEVGSPELSKAHVFAGDSLAYSFNVQLDADSPIDWANTITAKVDMPENSLFSDLDLNSGDKLFHVTALQGSGDEVSGDYTYKELKAGVPVTSSAGLVKNLITNHITVTVTLTLTGKTILDATTATEVPAATATFASSLHTATAKAQSFTAHTPLAGQTGAPSILSDTDKTPEDTTAHVDYVNIDQVGDVAEGSDYINLSGYYDSTSVTNDDQITMYAQIGQMQGDKWVGHVVHIQLPSRDTSTKVDGHTGRYSLSIPKPDLSGIQSFDSTNAPTSKGQALNTTSDQWLEYGMSDTSSGKNVVQIMAVDNQGRSSTPKRIAFNVGLLKFMSATKVTFKPTTLTGSQRVVGAESGPDVTLNNSLGNQWHVTATATPFTAGDKELKGSLYYVNAGGINTVLSDEAVPIADSSQLPTADSSNNYDVDLTQKWNTSQPDASSINGVTAQGLYVQLNAGATANSEITYQSAITWTLTDGPQ